MLGQPIEKAASGRYGWDVQVFVHVDRRVDHRSNHGQIAAHPTPVMTGGLCVDRSWLPGCCVDGLTV